MDARGMFGEHERSVRVARDEAKSNSCVGYFAGKPIESAVFYLNTPWWLIRN